MTVLATNELARARAARIRAGIQTYLHTLADIAAAYAQQDWKALGYANWQAYIDGEYSEHRLKLTPEHRRKAVEELRLSGMPTRAIAGTLGVNRETVMKDAREVVGNQPPQVLGADGKMHPSSRPSQPAAQPVEAHAGLNEADSAGRSVDEAGDGTGELPGAPVPPAAVEGPSATDLRPSADASREESSNAASVRPTAAGTPADQPSVGVPVNPSPVEDFLVNDPAVQAADYLAQFTSALARAGGFMSFDAERVAQLAGSSTWDAVEAHASVVAHWFSTAQKARRGLRVVKGGVA